MNGIHDLGGMHGHGAVLLDNGTNPPFYEPWQGRMFGIFLSIVVAGYIGLDEFRHEIEKLEPSFYLSANYYERWLRVCEDVLARKGVITSQELKHRVEQIRNQAP